MLVSENYIRKLIREALLGTSISEELQSLVHGDQHLRNVWSDVLKSAGDYNKITRDQFNSMREKFAKDHGTSPDDLFGDKLREKQILSLPNRIKFSELSKEDWNNFWLLAQHMDRHPGFQKSVLNIIRKHLGEDNNHFRYLDDRISCRETGTQRWGTQDQITNYSNCKLSGNDK